MIPLALLYAGDGEPIEGRTRMQKLVFLMQQYLDERDEYSFTSEEYEFIAYDYGPFSKELYDDLDSLSEQGHIVDSEEELRDGKEKYDYEIQPTGVDVIENRKDKEGAQEILQLAEDLKSQYNDVLLSELIDYVYSQYPKYAENSIY